MKEHSYEIKEVEEVVKKTKYIIVEDGEEQFMSYNTRDMAEIKIELYKAVEKIKHLPYYRYFYYCKNKEEFIDYASMVGYQTPYSEFITGNISQDKHFIREIDNIWHGPDWYKLTITKDDGDTYYSVNTFSNIKAECEAKIKEFEDALAHPKTFRQTVSNNFDDSDK